jgi:hypothetical protein
MHCQRDCRDLAIRRAIGAAFVRRQRLTRAPSAGHVTTCRASSLGHEILKGPTDELRGEPVQGVTASQPSSLKSTAAQVVVPWA